MKFRCAVLAIAFTVLTSAGFWARHKMIVARIGAIFAETVFGPVLDQYTSAEWYDEAKKGQIEREMHELRLQLDVEGNQWQIIMFVFFLGAGVAGIYLAWKVLDRYKRTPSTAAQK